jgi:DNA mismatch repair protein MutL
MEALVDELFACEEPYYDPLKHPTILFMSMSEIQKRFR